MGTSCTVWSVWGCTKTSCSNTLFCPEYSLLFYSKHFVCWRALDTDVHATILDLLQVRVQRFLPDVKPSDDFIGSVLEHVNVKADSTLGHNLLHAL